VAHRIAFGVQALQNPQRAGMPVPGNRAPGL
jgi:hypothetical protein